MTIPGVIPLEYVMARCHRYGIYVRWSDRKNISDHQPMRMTSWWGPIVMDPNMGYDKPTIRDCCPVDIKEALETRRCIDALPHALREAILEEHVIGGSQEEKAESQDCHRSTHWRRCQAAYPRLLELFNLAAAGLPIDA